MAHLYHGKRGGQFLRYLAAGLVFLLLVSACLYAVGRADEANAERQTEVLRDAIRSAAVTCYAIEGCYPRTLSYLVERYGLVIDFDRYLVYYEALGANILPTVVVERRGGGV